MSKTMMSKAGISIVIIMVLGNYDVSSLQQDRSDSGVSVYGYKFVVALPEYQVTKNFLHVYYVLHTVDPGMVNVTLMKVWSPDHALMKHVYGITSGQHMIVKLDDHFWGSALSMQTRWTHVLEANSMFALEVYLKSERNNIVASFQAVSEWAWLNAYIVFTPNYRPSLQIVNGATEQTVRFKPPVNRILEFITLFIEYINTDYQYTHLLRSYEGVSIQLCSETTKYNNLTGSRVLSANPVGVIVGSCFYQQTDGVHSGTESAQDASLEMLRGETKFSVEFLVGKTSDVDGYLYIVFTSDNTSVQMETAHWEMTINNYRSVEMSLHKDLNYPVSVKSNQPITVALVMTNSKPCNGQKIADISLSQYVPDEMLMDNYQWVTDDDPGLSHRLLFIFHFQTATFTYFDDLRIDRSYVFSHDHYKRHGDQVMVEFVISTGYHQLYSTRHYKLHAYIFGIGSWRNISTAYMQPAGFIAMHGGPLNGCWPTSMNVKGDMTDNDCDSRIDEEVENKLDDDGDGLIDEDRGRSKLTNGHWTIWETWQCESSFASFKTRTRFCNDPPPHNNGLKCPGNSTEVEILQNENCMDIVSGIVHGNWSILSSTCLDCSNISGLANVSRKCDNPAPKRGGRPCSGQPFVIVELKECIEKCASYKKKPTQSTTTATTMTVRTTTTTTPEETSNSTGASESNYTRGFPRSSTNFTTDRGNSTHFKNVGSLTTSNSSNIISTMSTTSTKQTPKNSSSSTNNTSTLFYTSHNSTVIASNVTLITPLAYENITRSSLTSANNETTTSSTLEYNSSTNASESTKSVTTMSSNESKSTVGLATTEYVPATEAILYPGSWGEWSVWGCMDNCTVKNVVRTRPCADPPEGPRSFDCPGYAYQFGMETSCNFICAATCPHGLWGFNCSKACPNCEDPCDQMTGHCSQCKPGYQHPQKQCSGICPAYTFGFDCLGDCGDLCEGYDCIDRVLGLCPATHLQKNLLYGLFALLILPVCLLCNLRGRHHTYDSAEDNDLLKSVKVKKTSLEDEPQNRPQVKPEPGISSV